MNRFPISVLVVTLREGRIFLLWSHFVLFGQFERIGQSTALDTTNLDRLNDSVNRLQTFSMPHFLSS